MFCILLFFAHPISTGSEFFPSLQHEEEDKKGHCSGRGRSRGFGAGRDGAREREKERRRNAAAAVSKKNGAMLVVASNLSASLASICRLLSLVPSARSELKRCRPPFFLVRKERQRRTTKEETLKNSGLCSLPLSLFSYGTPNSLLLFSSAPQKHTTNRPRAPLPSSTRRTRACTLGSTR